MAKGPSQDRGSATRVASRPVRFRQKLSEGSGIFGIGSGMAFCISKPRPSFMMRTAGLLFFVMSAACSSPLHLSFDRLQEVRSGWSYAWQEPSGQRSTFAPLDVSASPPRPSHDSVLILHYDVPGSVSSDSCLYLGRVVEAFEAYVGTDRIYEYGEGVYLAGAPWHIIPIGMARGQTLEFRIHSEQRSIGIAGPVVLGSRADLYEYVIRMSAGRGVLGAFFLLLGVFIIIVFLPSPMRRDSLAFSLFLFLMGLHVLSQTPVRLFFVSDPGLWLAARLITIYLLPPSYGAFIDTSFSKKGDWMGRIWIIALVWGLLSLILTSLRLVHWHSLVLAYYPVVALTGLAAFWIPARRAREGDFEARLYLIGFAGFVILTLPDLMGGLGWATMSTAHVGMFILVCSIAFILMGRHSRLLHDMAHITGELRSVQREIEITHTVHLGLLPDHPPLVSGLSWSIDYLPSARVGGDFYDFASGDEGVCVLLADVTGHGVPAAVFASSVKMAFGLEEHHIGDPALVLRNMNRSLYGRVGDQLLTATCTLIDLKRWRIVHASAGHLPALFWRARTRELCGLKPRGRLMGFSADPECENLIVEGIETGDRLILFTDGLTEATNRQGEPFGEDRLMQLVRDSADVSIEEFRHRLRLLLQTWNGGTLPLEDDLTLLALQITACR